MLQFLNRYILFPFWKYSETIYVYSFHFENILCSRQRQEMKVRAAWWSIIIYCHLNIIIILRHWGMAQMYHGWGTIHPAVLLRLSNLPWNLHLSFVIGGGVQCTFHIKNLLLMMCLFCVLFRNIDITNTYLSFKQLKMRLATVA